MTIEIYLPLPSEKHDFLIAALWENGFEAFVEDGEALRIYLPKENWTTQAQKQLDEWLALHQPLTDYQLTEIPPQNWNEAWENSIEPIEAGDFIIAPTWAQLPTTDKTVLRIDPKMSFGTGHHESTRLILRLLPDYIQKGSRWMDAGTGTGVLAIAVLKLGAAWVFAFDNDEWVRENVAENLQLNQVASSQIGFEVCSLEEVTETNFDGIIANIHLVVLQQFMPLFAQKLTNGAPLLLAGLLQTDREAILKTAAEHGFQLEQALTENQWMALALRRVS